jgi:hypothetical protein
MEVPGMAWLSPNSAGPPLPMIRKTVYLVLFGFGMPVSLVSQESVYGYEFEPVQKLQDPPVGTGHRATTRMRDDDDAPKRKAVQPGLAMVGVLAQFA